MATSSETPLLMDSPREDPSPAVASDMVRIELTEMACLPLQSPIDTVHQSSSTRSVETGRHTCESTLGVPPSGDRGPSTELPDDGTACLERPVTRCMCCEGSGGTEAQDEDATPPQVSQLGARGYAGAPSGKRTDRPRILVASQSLPSIPLASMLHASGRPYRSSAQSAGAGLPLLGPHRPSVAHPSSLAGHPRVAAVVSDSMLSLPAGDICRICHTGRRHEPLIGPCLCAGSMRYTHQRCLTMWLAQSGRSSCELCGYKFKTKMVGSRNIFQWKVLRMTLVDKLHLAVFALSLLLFAGTAAYVGWTATGSTLSSYSDPASLATQILLPVYCSLCLMALGLALYEAKSTCLRLARRWRALNMGLAIMEREIDDDGRGLPGGRQGGGAGPPGTRALEVAADDHRTESPRVGADGVPSDWSVWTACNTESQSHQRLSSV